MHIFACVSLIYVNHTDCRFPSSVFRLVYFPRRKSQARNARLVLHACRCVLFVEEACLKQQWKKKKTGVLRLLRAV